MSEKRAPWLKWYPADWRADPRLRMCSLAARGLWIELLGFMHEADPYGHLLIGGRVPTAQNIAVLVGAPPQLVQRCLDELRDNGVFSVAEDGAPYSRRMVRDKAKADQDRANGKRGGNPKIAVPVNPDIAEGVNPPDKAQIPEARDQKLELEPPTAPRKRVAGLTGAALAEFERWYELYPRKVARGAAEKAFITARKIASFEQLAAGVTRYARSVEGKEPGYVAHPATWLNGKRWLDDSSGSFNGLAEPRRPHGPPPKAPTVQGERERPHG